MFVDFCDLVQFVCLCNHHLVPTYLFKLIVNIFHRNFVDINRRLVGTVLGIISCQLRQNPCIYQFEHQIIHQSDGNTQFMAQHIRTPGIAPLFKVLDDVVGD